MTQHDQKRLNDMSKKVLAVLGPETLRMLTRSAPRWSAFAMALKRTHPSAVTQQQIQGALQTALHVWPLEAESSLQQSSKQPDL